MTRKLNGWLAIVAGAALVAGCDLDGSKSGQKDQRRDKLVQVPGLAPLEPAGPGPKRSESKPESKPESPPVGRPAPGPAHTPTAKSPTGPVKPVAPPPPAPGMVRIRAEPGVGKRGRYEGEGLLVTPIKAYYHIREFAELKWKLPKTLQIYKNMPGQGLPKTAEEFMKMCKDNNISLPDLPPGETYVYDPTTGELFVEKPR